MLKLYKPGGVFGGHDYNLIKQAVEQFFMGKEKVTIGLPPSSDWWVIKEK